MIKTNKMTDLYDALIKILKTESRFVSGGGELLKNAVYEAAYKNDPMLLKLLHENEITHSRFFTVIDDKTEVFNTVEFGWVVSNKQFLPDSYTRFANKIGLTDKGGDFIVKNDDVVLSFPYKDCILVGGQTKDDQKRAEIFYNVTLAPDKTDVLLDPKVLVKARRYTAVGIEENVIFSDEDNLIIKGNNLLVISSLLKRYEGRVKCIYIDPPYNTGSDSFGYNDSFNRSSWLVFMKNRLEIARRLLHKDGVILIQLSFHQYPYLRVLADEIFSEVCHQFDMNTLVRHPERNLTSDKRFNDVIEYTLIYSKSPEFKMPKREIYKTDDDYQYNFILPAEPDDKLVLGGKEVKIYLPQNIIKNRTAGHTGGLKSMSIRGSIREKNSSGRFYVAHLENKTGIYPEGTFFSVPDMGDDGQGYRLFELPRGGNKNGVYYQGKPQSNEITYKPYPNFVDFVQQYNNVNDEGGCSFRNGKKPEEYIRYYLDIFTSEGDLVLDFNLGSGTTAAVAHKTGRKYIGVEQMDYIDEKAVGRLKNVILGEDSGISRAIDWQGGGSFIYCELAECNKRFIDEIEAMETNESLSDLLERTIRTGFISSKIDPAKIFENAMDFEALSIEEKKRFVMELLDMNMLYVNFSDIDDAEYNICDADKAFTRSFYKSGD